MLDELYNQLAELNLNISKYDDEIKYLEELLVTTSGAADDVVADLKKNQSGRRELSKQYCAIYDQIQAIKKTN